MISSIGSNLIELAFVVREVILHRRNRQLLLKSIDLVQEQDNGGLDEPPGIADGVEQGESLLHTVDGFIFEQELIVLGYGDEEEDGSDVLKAVDPLLTFRSLTSDIEHAVCKLANDKSSLRNACSLYSRSKYVLVIR